MTKIFTSLILAASLYATDIPIAHVQKHLFSQTIDVNAKIIQLSNAKQSIMSLLDGHIENYFVQPGDRVNRGDAIALIDSITLSRMSSEYLSLKKQYASENKNYRATQKLYKKGLTSLNTLNEQNIQRNALLSKLNTLKSQLKTLGIDTKTLKKPTSEYILRAHSEGVVSQILQPLHSVITENTKIVEIIKEHSYYLKSFVPIKYADKIKRAQKATLNYLKRNISTKITQILPKVDTATQRIVVLSSIDANLSDLFIGAYVPATIYIAPHQKHLAVKKSALSFFNNEWVVFVPAEEEHEEHEHETHEEVPYTPKVVKILEEDDDFAAVEGLKEGEPYVSDKCYYVKSLLLKSAMGEHGH